MRHFRPVCSPPVFSPWYGVIRVLSLWFSSDKPFHRCTCHRLPTLWLPFCTPAGASGAEALDEVRVVNSVPSMVCTFGCPFCLQAVFVCPTLVKTVFSFRNCGASVGSVDLSLSLDSGWCFVPCRVSVPAPRCPRSPAVQSVLKPGGRSGAWLCLQRLLESLQGWLERINPQSPFPYVTVSLVAVIH